MNAREWLLSALLLSIGVVGGSAVSVAFKELLLALQPTLFFVFFLVVAIKEFRKSYTTLHFEAATDEWEAVTTFSLLCGILVFCTTIFSDSTFDSVCLASGVMITTSTAFAIVKLKTQRKKS